MLKFNDWVSQVYEYLFPSIDSGKISKTVDIMRDHLKKYLGDLTVIHNLDVFSRENEPVQTRTVFSTKDLRSFGANFTEDGKLYSIDFYGEEGPELTMYIKKGSLFQVLKLIPILIDDPRPLKKKEIDEILNENIINENEERPIVTFQVPPSPEIIVRTNEYEYGDPKIIFEDLKKYVDMVIDGKQPSLVITGSPGVGKTFLVTKQLENRGLKKGEDWVHIKGRSTPAGLYIALYENKDKILVIDDCDSVFRNEEAVNILKSALDSYETREISWLVGKPLVSPLTGQKIPTKFMFDGAVIFISNLPQKKIDYAIKSRSFVLEVALTPEDMIKRMEELLPTIYTEVPFVIRKTALDIIKRNYVKMDNLELSMRTLIKAIKIINEVDNLADAERLIIQQCSYK